MAVLALASLSPVAASAQACCAGGTAFAPARLKLFEDALVGLQLKGIDQVGSFDGAARYDLPPAGDSELDLEQDIAGALRIDRHAQVGVVVPFVETRRTVPGLAELGGGLGDVSANGRYDFTQAAGGTRLPGLALLLGVTAPSGRPPEQADTPLATGATGTGAWQGALGAEIEEIVGSWVVDLAASIWGAIPRSVDGTTEELGPRVTGLAAFGYAFTERFALVLTGSYEWSTNSWIDGKAAPGTSVELFTAGVSCGWSIDDHWRLQAAVTDDLPVLGRNIPVAGVGGNATLIRSWTF